jgi:predicted DNA-binding mobile mystery protein A
LNRKSYAKIYRKIQLDDLNESAMRFLSDWRSRPVRPDRGWLRTIREALGLTLEQVGSTAKMKRQSLNELERAEASEKITLASLRRVAEAMGCELVYAILPKSGNFKDLAERIAQQKTDSAEQKAREQATKFVRDVDQTMALEGQSTGRTKERIAEETERILKGRKK